MQRRCRRSVNGVVIGDIVTQFDHCLLIRTHGFFRSAGVVQQRHLIRQVVGTIRAVFGEYLVAAGDAQRFRLQFELCVEIVRRIGNPRVDRIHYSLLVSGLLGQRSRIGLIHGVAGRDAGQFVVNGREPFLDFERNDIGIADFIEQIRPFARLAQGEVTLHLIEFAAVVRFVGRPALWGGWRHIHVVFIVEFFGERRIVVVATFLPGRPGLVQPE